MITLKTLPQATKQEVFDHCKNHLLSQLQKSSGRFGSGGAGCCYRNPQGLKCAAGCFISDEEYGTHFEGFYWFDLVAKGMVPSKHSDLIASLQLIHDKFEPSEWCSKLKKLANSHDLNYENTGERVHI